MRKILFYILICYLLSSCIGEAPKESDLKGTIENNQFRNKYLSIKIIDDWKSIPANGEGEFLLLTRDHAQEAKISFFGFKKDLGDKMLYSKEYASQKLIEGIKADNKELQSSYENKSLTLDGTDFLVTKFTFKAQGETYQMIYYVGEIEDFYLGVFYTDNIRSKEHLINKVIFSIKFNK